MQLENKIAELKKLGDDKAALEEQVSLETNTGAFIVPHSQHSQPPTFAHRQQHLTTRNEYNSFRDSSLAEISVLKDEHQKKLESTLETVRKAADDSNWKIDNIKADANRRIREMEVVVQQKLREQQQEIQAQCDLSLKEAQIRHDAEVKAVRAEVDRRVLAEDVKRQELVVATNEEKQKLSEEFKQEVRRREENFQRELAARRLEFEGSEVEVKRLTSECKETREKFHEEIERNSNLRGHLDAVKNELAQARGELQIKRREGEFRVSWKRSSRIPSCSTGCGLKL